MWLHGGEYEEYCPIRTFRRPCCVHLQGTIWPPPRPACPSCIDSFAVVFIRLSMCFCIVVLPRSLETLVNVCWTAWHHTAEGCVRRGIRLWESTCFLKMAPNTWMNGDFGGIRTCEIVKRCASHYFINFAHVVFRENIVCPVFFRSALCIFWYFWKEHRFGNWICFNVVRWRCSALVHLVW